MKKVVRSILSACLLAGLAHADLLLDDFEHGLDWVAEKNIEGSGQSPLSLTGDAVEGEKALLVSDETTKNHFYWLTKTCADGVWDWSQHRYLVLWLRGDGNQTRQLYAKAVDERGRQMFWELGTLKGNDWKHVTVDISQDSSVFRHENPNLARIVKVGIRCNSGHGYAFAVDRVELTEPLAPPTTAMPQTTFVLDRPICYLASRRTEDVGPSMVGANLQTGELTTAHIDRLAAAGVKWAARMPLAADSPHAQKIRAALLQHKFQLLAHVSFTSKPNDNELAHHLAQLKKNATALHRDIRVWEFGNEPNIGKFWKPAPNPIEFGQTVIAYAKALRSVDPTLTIISGGLVGYDMDFAKAMLSTGLGDWVDVIGIHTPRWCPEYASVGVDHADALAEFRKLIESVNPTLVVWQTEVQAVGGVERAESGISDYEEARHIGRRFLYERTLGIPVSFWQTLKARPDMEHPGALLRADGTPTIKYCAIRNVAAILDDSLVPSDVPVEIDDHQQSRQSLHKSGPFTVSSRWESPSIPVPPRQNIDLTATVKSNGETIDARIVWLDAAGKVLEAVGNDTPLRAATDSVTPLCRRYPPEFRPNTAHAARVVVTAAPDHPLDVQSLAVTACGTSSAVKARVLPFTRDGKLFISWWLDSRPGPAAILGSCTIRVRCSPDQLTRPVCVDLIDGTVRNASIRRDGDWAVLENLPLTDYSFILADQDSLTLTTEAPLTRDFASPDDLTRQFIGDRFGLGRPEYWRRVALALGDKQTPLAAAWQQATAWFDKRLEPTTAAVAITDIPIVDYHSSDLYWRPSMLNPKTRHVDRYFLDLERKIEPAQLRVLDGERELPQGQWEDNAERAGQWFLENRSPSRLATIVPKGQRVATSLTLHYPMAAYQPIVHPFRDPVSNSAVLVLWSTPSGKLPAFSGDVTVSGPADAIPAQAAVIDLATGQKLRLLQATQHGDQRRLSGIPITPKGVMVVDKALNTQAQ